MINAMLEQFTKLGEAAMGAREDLGQCEHSKPKRCSRKGVTRVGGKVYCRKHDPDAITAREELQWARDLGCVKHAATGLWTMLDRKATSPNAPEGQS